jgi:flagellar protein FlaJ
MIPATTTAREDPPAGTSSATVPERGSTGSSWLWIVWVPALPVALGLAVWGLWLMVTGHGPPMAPPLPDPFGGIDLVGVALVVGLAPYGVFAALRDKRRRQIDEHFPDFLTDLAANRRAGFTLSESVRLAADSEYGPLTDNVEKMRAQISWNIPFEEALQRFAERVDTPLVTRSVTLVLEAERTGGHITDVLEAVSRDAREIKRLDRERRLSMRMYTIIMYVAFAVFLGVVGVLQGQLLPQLVSASAPAQGGPLANIAAKELTLESYRTFFYVAALVQGTGSGILAGFMARGKLGPGLLHAAVMAAITVATFSFLIV